MSENKKQVILPVYLGIGDVGREKREQIQDWAPCQHIASICGLTARDVEYVHEDGIYIIYIPSGVNSESVFSELRQAGLCPTPRFNQIYREDVVIISASIMPDRLVNGAILSLLEAAGAFDEVACPTCQCDGFLSVGEGLYTCPTCHGERLVENKKGE